MSRERLFLTPIDTEGKREVPSLQGSRGYPCFFINA
jgi:hypothetical protein